MRSTATLLPRDRLRLEVVHADLVRAVDLAYWLDDGDGTVEAGEIR